MKLSVLDRILLLNILPAEGDLTTIKIIRELKEALSFSEEEHKALEIKMQEGRVFWNPAASVEKDVKIKDKAKETIVTALKDLDTKQKITVEIIPLYEKFIP